MAIIETLLQELEQEAQTTRRVLERVPDASLGWKPHEKSMSLGGLATHLANLPTWAEIALKQSEFDLAASPPAPLASSRRELLERIDRNTANARAALAGRTDGELMAPWTLKSGSHTIFTMPKTSVLRSFCLNHIVHHRGQLSVYLRLLNVPVPSIYGPSADEGQT